MMKGIQVVMKELIARIKVNNLTEFYQKYLGSLLNEKITFKDKEPTSQIDHNIYVLNKIYTGMHTWVLQFLMLLMHFTN